MIGRERRVGTPVHEHRALTVAVENEHDGCRDRGGHLGDMSVDPVPAQGVTVAGARPGPCTPGERDVRAQPTQPSSDVGG
ncbi:MAG: hypothetical protein WKF83_15115 [Nocardioidaceae bacterium]